MIPCGSGERLIFAFGKKYGLEVPQGLNDKLEGYSFHETAVYFKEHFPLPLTIEEIMGTWNRMASEIYINEIRLKEGVKEFIELLKNGI